MGFNCWKDFHNFQEYVKFTSRFIHSPSIDEFLLNIDRTLSAREHLLSKGEILYRGQIGFGENEVEGQRIPCAFKADRMKPIPNKGKEGRGNPKGISYLYLSDDENTALTELRAHLGQGISSAKFEIRRDLRIVDCHSVTKYYSYAELVFNPPQSQEELTNAMWSMINDAFTKPVTNEDERSDYVPTQILAEYFKFKKFDGIRFKSSMGKGNNILLFNLNDAEMIECVIMTATKISYSFDKYDPRPY